jgi:hypothetical protein
MTDEGPTISDPETDPERVGHLGACLRASFVTEDHSTLDVDVIRLLLHLSREPNPPGKAKQVSGRAARGGVAEQPTGVPAPAGATNSSGRRGPLPIGHFFRIGRKKSL